MLYGLPFETHSEEIIEIWGNLEENNLLPLKSSIFALLSKVRSQKWPDRLTVRDGSATGRLFYYSRDVLMSHARVTTQAGVSPDRSFAERRSTREGGREA